MPGLQEFIAEFGILAVFGAAIAVAAGGFTKGVVGFALPLVSLSGMGSFLPFEVALALLIVPTLVSNLTQALRNGAGAAWASLRAFWRLNLVLVATIALAAQLVVALPERLLFALLGVAIAAFGISQLAGWRPRLRDGRQGPAEVGVGLLAGFFGGISGIWGPPIVMYLLAAQVPKVAMVRAQGLSYLLGSVVLVGAHLRSGVLNPVTLPLSAWLVVPAMAGMLAGFGVQDRLDQAVFRNLTLAVLTLAGLNLLRRAWMA